MHFLFVTRPSEVEFSLTLIEMCSNVHAQPSIGAARRATADDPCIDTQVYRKNLCITQMNETVSNKNSLKKLLRKMEVNVPMSRRRCKGRPPT